MKANPGVEQAILERKRSQPAISNRALAKAFDVHHSVVERVLAGGSSSSESSTMTADTWAFESKTRERVTTLEQLIEFCKIDTGVWSIERWVCNKWEVGAVGADGRLQAEPLYQIKATMRKKQSLVDARSEIEDLKELAKNYAPAERFVTKPADPGEHCLEIAIVDHHFGKMGWNGETGYESYDLKIAERIYWEAFYALLERTKQFSFEEALLVVGNDLFQADSAEGATTKGTLVSCDGRYQKVFRVVRNTIIRSIEELRKIAGTVKVYLVSGNHDEQTVWSLGSSLECYFHNQTDVVVENNPEPRKYWVYGDNLLMLTHGHKVKSTKLPLLMATEKPRLFGAATFREVHKGHTHTKRGELVLLEDVSEEMGVRVRTLPALTGVDDYHASNGYVGNLRQSEAFVWSRTEGIVTTASYTHREAA